MCSPADRSLFHIQIGGNDFMYALQVGTPVETLATVIGPQTASNISLAITVASLLSSYRSISTSAGASISLQTACVSDPEHVVCHL